MSKFAFTAAIQTVVRNTQSRSNLATLPPPNLRRKKKYDGLAPMNTVPAHPSHVDPSGTALNVAGFSVAASSFIPSPALLNLLLSRGCRAWRLW